MPSRRAFVAGSIALTAFPAAAAKRLPPPKIGAIYWPGPGHDLHGFMAIPATAHGPQPAVLVLPGAGGADQYARGLTDALALAGFVACVPRTALSIDEALATVRWLATNRYGTGKVAAVGIGDSDALVGGLAVSPGTLLSCGIVFGDPPSAHADGAVPVLHLPSPSNQDQSAYLASWQEAVAFLEEHLGRD